MKDIIYKTRYSLILIVFSLTFALLLMNYREAFEGLPTPLQAFFVALIGFVGIALVWLDRDEAKKDQENLNQ